MTRIFVENPFDFDSEKHRAAVFRALDPVFVQERLEKIVSDLHAPAHYSFTLISIRVLRYKPEKRCIVEYLFVENNPVGSAGQFGVLGKIGLAKQVEHTAFNLQSDFSNAGFHNNSADGVSVPLPLGVISECRMWLQQQIPGTTVATQLTGVIPPDLAGQIAGAIHKVHSLKIPVQRTHFIEDELKILRNRLGILSRKKPDWGDRLEKILVASHKLAQTLNFNCVCGIHRDFYPDQVLTSNERIFLLDFDLYCLGDPNLDMGNFVAHVTEFGLRQFDDPFYFRNFEQLLMEQLVELSEMVNRQAITVYSTLSLVRHIYISTLHSSRIPYTKSIMELCEEKLKLGHDNKVYV